MAPAVIIASCRLTEVDAPVGPSTRCRMKLRVPASRIGVRIPATSSILCEQPAVWPIMSIRC